MVRRSAAAVFAVFLLVLLFTITPSAVCAQKIELFVGDSFLAPAVGVTAQPAYCPVLGTCSAPATTITNRQRLNGWEISATHRFTSSLSITADASGHYGLATSGFPVNGRARQYLLMGGPQLSGHSRIAPFVHVLAGATRQSATASGNTFLTTFPSGEWGFAAAAGGGFDVKISSDFSFRLIQADYVLTHLGGNFQGAPRIAMGFSFRF